MSANSSSCTQSADDTTGLVYQKVQCNPKNGILLKIALCQEGDEEYEVYLSTTDVPPTTENYQNKTVLKEKRNGHFELVMTVPSGSGTKCIIGVRPVTGKCL